MEEAISAPGWRVSDCGQAPQPYQGSRKSKLTVRVAAPKDPQLLLEGILGRGQGRRRERESPFFALIPSHWPNLPNS